MRLSYFKIFLLFSFWWSIPFGLFAIIGSDSRESMKAVTFMLSAGILAVMLLMTKTSNKETKQYRAVAGFTAFFLSGFFTLMIESPIESFTGVRFSGGESMFSGIFATALTINFLVAFSVFISDCIRVRKERKGNA